MNFRNRRLDDVELNITPLIDVVFLLLIFFMVSTTFERESQINITLPEASEEVKEQEHLAIEVSIDARGEIYVNEQKLVNAQLLTIREALRIAAELGEDPQVIISADENAAHQTVIRVMDAARQLGLVRITFATKLLTDELGE